MTQNYPVILFDGVCNYCNAVVNFLIKKDKKKVFRFAALQSEAGEKLLQQYRISTKAINSFVLINNGTAYTKSTAGLHLFNLLPWYWKWTQIFWMAPAFIRDGVYDFIAKNRYSWFGKREQCMIPAADVKSRFLDADFTS